MASPLSNVDKITIVSTGNGATAGASKITGDMAAIAAQVPALFESLSGMSMAELFSKVKQIGDNGPKPAPELPSGSDPAGGKAKAATKS
jgi:flotillin